MTDISKEAVERLLDGVTPGPWAAGRGDMQTYIDGVPSKWIYAGEQYVAVASGKINGSWGEVMANARFIAAARDLVPALAAEAAALRDEVARLRKVETWQIKMRADAMTRRHMNAPEDQHVAALCERHGYGAVIDAASRLWARKDCMGAFYVGGCIGFRSEDEARDAITAEPLGHGVTADDFGGEA